MDDPQRESGDTLWLLHNDPVSGLDSEEATPALCQRLRAEPIGFRLWIRLLDGSSIPARLNPQPMILTLCRLTKCPACGLPPPG